MIEQKKKLREEYKKIRDEISPETQVLKSVSIWKHFFDLEEYKNAKTVMLYCDIKSEVKTTNFARRILSDGKRMVFPVTDKERGELIPYEVDDILSLKMGTFKVLEPNMDLIRDGKVKAIEKGEIDLVIVPGVAFDIYGYRIGYGKGYYDHFLKDYKGVKVGFSYTDCVLYSVFPQDNDIKMDMLITEAGCERFEQEI